MEYAENGPNGGHPSEAIAMVSAEERYRSLVDAIRDYAIFLLDPTGHVASWNAGAERIKGYRADEIIGQHFSVFYPSDAQQRGYPAEELARAVTLGRWEDEGWRIRRDGSRFWANVVITPLRDREGMLVGFAKVTRDLTERRSNEERLRQSEERLRLLMDAVEDAVFMLDRTVTSPAGTPVRSGSKVSNRRRSSATTCRVSIRRKTSRRASRRGNWRPRPHRAGWRTRAGGCTKTDRVSGPTS